MPPLPHRQEPTLEDLEREAHQGKPGMFSLSVLAPEEGALGKVPRINSVLELATNDAGLDEVLDGGVDSLHRLPVHGNAGILAYSYPEEFLKHSDGVRIIKHVHLVAYGHEVLDVAGAHPDVFLYQEAEALALHFRHLGLHLRREHSPEGREVLVRHPTPEVVRLADAQQLLVGQPGGRASTVELPSQFDHLLWRDVAPGPVVVAAVDGIDRCLHSYALAGVGRVRRRHCRCNGQRGWGGLRSSLSLLLLTPARLVGSSRGRRGLLPALRLGNLHLGDALDLGHPPQVKPKRLLHGLAGRYRLSRDLAGHGCRRFGLHLLGLHWTWRESLPLNGAV
mmetsp:Transcript_19379/g.42315  ORF Transcript_19379/g.42315 Transcript_19379/m.42315 type:complete len:336 (+) Transcript_19379:1064-2071(+)